MIKLNRKTRQSIDQSVLCWLATVNGKGVPNVTPKQIFTHHKDTIIIAHIASPNSVANIQVNANVCVSMVDVFEMWGFKFIGTAQYYDESSADFDVLAPILRTIAGPDFSILGVMQVAISAIEPIFAPSYKLFPERTVAERAASEMAQYGVQPK